MFAEARAPRRRGRWAALLVAMVCAIGLSAVLDGARPTGPRSSLAADALHPIAETPCDHWALLSGGGQARGANVSLFTNGLAVWRACDPSPHELQLRGTPAAGVGAFAVLVDEAGVAFAGLLAGEARVEVSGDLRLYFSNDVATADEDRNLHAVIR